MPPNVKFSGPPGPHHQMINARSARAGPLQRVLGSPEAGFRRFGLREVNRFMVAAFWRNLHLSVNRFVQVVLLPPNVPFCTDRFGLFPCYYHSSRSRGALPQLSRFAPSHLVIAACYSSIEQFGLATSQELPLSQDRAVLEARMGSGDVAPATDCSPISLLGRLSTFLFTTRAVSGGATPGMAPLRTGRLVIAAF